MLRSATAALVAALLCVATLPALCKDVVGDAGACPGFTYFTQTHYEAPGAVAVGQPSPAECCRACSELPGGCWAWAFCGGASCLRADGSTAEPDTCILSTAAAAQGARRGAWFESGEDVAWVSGVSCDSVAATAAASAVVPHSTCPASGTWTFEGGNFHKPGKMRAVEIDNERNITEDYLESMKGYISYFQQEEGAVTSTPPERRSMLMERLLGEGPEPGCGPVEAGSENSSVAREYLVVVPVGDNFDASRWMNDPAVANWDLVAIYYGQKDSFACPECKAVFRLSGPKWRLIFGLTQTAEWKEYRKMYKAIMVPDDDLTLDVCTINTVFNTLTAFDLLVAQPSVCNVAGSYTLWNTLYQEPQNLLRYTSMVEIMAPTFEMEFFQNFIRPSLYNAYFGWGLDFVWPFLLEYPQDKFAVVDRVCMLHRKSTPGKKFSLYKAYAPFSAKEEESFHYYAFNYTMPAMKSMGFEEAMPVMSYGAVENPSWKNSTRMDYEFFAAWANATRLAMSLEYNSTWA